MNSISCKLNIEGDLINNKNFKIVPDYRITVKYIPLDDITKGAYRNMARRSWVFRLVLRFGRRQD